jgi:hypothetical protein
VLLVHVQQKPSVALVDPRAYSVTQPWEAAALRGIVVGGDMLARIGDAREQLRTARARGTNDARLHKWRVQVALNQMWCSAGWDRWKLPCEPTLVNEISCDERTESAQEAAADGRQQCNVAKSNAPRRRTSTTLQLDGVQDAADLHEREEASLADLRY